MKAKKNKLILLCFSISIAGILLGFFLGMATIESRRKDTATPTNKSDSPIDPSSQLLIDNFEHNGIADLTVGKTWRHSATEESGYFVVSTVHSITVYGDRIVYRIESIDERENNSVVSQFRRGNELWQTWGDPEEPLQCELVAKFDCANGYTWKSYRLSAGGSVQYTVRGMEDAIINGANMTLYRIDVLYPIVGLQPRSESYWYSRSMRLMRYTKSGIQYTLNH